MISNEQTLLRETQPSFFYEKGAYGFGILTGLGVGVYTGIQMFQTSPTEKSDWAALGASITLIAIASFALYKTYSQISPAKDLSTVVTLISTEEASDLLIEDNSALPQQASDLQEQVSEVSNKEYDIILRSYYENQITLVTQLLAGVNLEELTPEMINNFQEAKRILTNLTESSNSSAASSTTTSTFNSTVHTPSKRTPAPSPFSTPAARTRI